MKVTEILVEALVLMIQLARNQRCLLNLLDLRIYFHWILEKRKRFALGNRFAAHVMSEVIVRQAKVFGLNLFDETNS